MSASCLRGKFACGVVRIHIRHFADFCQVGFARQREHFRDHRLVQAFVAQYRTQRVDQALIDFQRLARLMLANQFLQHLHLQLLAGIPAVEAVAVVLHQEHQLIAVVRKV